MILWSALLNLRQLARGAVWGTELHGFGVRCVTLQGHALVLSADRRDWDARALQPDVRRVGGYRSTKRYLLKLHGAGLR